LEEQQELAFAFNTAMTTPEPVPLEPILAYKLSSMGLIQLDGNKAMPSYPLYREYFQQTLRKR
ncbi:MAG: AAA-like domain-containing protein, partial [Planktothrix sp.]